MGAADSTGRRNTSIPEVLMGRPAGWMTALTGRSPMKSPGAPAHRREVEREFWREIVKGLLAEEAALAVGVSQAVGSRWFRHRGGMPSIDLGPLSGRYLTFREREEIAILKGQGARSRGSSAVPRRRSRGSCAATRRRAEASSTTALRWHSGRPSLWRSAPGPRSWSRTTGCASMCKSGCQVRSAARTGRRLRGRRRRRGRPQQAASRRPAVGDGMERGADRQPADGRLP